LIKGAIESAAVIYLEGEYSGTKNNGKSELFSLLQDVIPHVNANGYDGMQGSGYHTQIEWDLLQTMYNFNGLLASIYKAQ
jgi:hypothetical protein